MIWLKGMISIILKIFIKRIISDLKRVSHLPESKMLIGILTFHLFSGRSWRSWLLFGTVVTFKVFQFDQIRVSTTFLLWCTSVHLSSEKSVGNRDICEGFTTGRPHPALCNIINEGKDPHSMGSIQKTKNPLTVEPTYWLILEWINEENQIRMRANNIGSLDSNCFLSLHEMNLLDIIRLPKN